MNIIKLMELNDYLRENAYDLSLIDFMSLIGTTVDEYCAKNGLDTNETWEDLNEVRKQVFKDLGGADYMK